MIPLDQIHSYRVFPVQKADCHRDLGDLPAVRQSDYKSGWLAYRK